MQYFDYKVVAAPSRSKKTKGVREPSDLYALTLTDTINEHAREGWEYVRAETLVAKTPRGVFKRETDDSVAVLVFRRERRNLEPRLEAANTVQPAPAAAPYAQAAPATVQAQPAAVVVTAPPQVNTVPQTEKSDPPSFAERIQRTTEAHPEGIEPVAEQTDPPSPLRPTPTLGPADRG